MTLEPTGWCWECGRALDVGFGTLQALFCRPACQRKYDREQEVQRQRIERKGKRAGYGPAGSTH